MKEHHGRNQSSSSTKYSTKKMIIHEKASHVSKKFYRWLCRKGWGLAGGYGKLE